MNIRYFLSLILFSSISAYLFYALFSDLDFTMKKAPWVVLGIFLLPVSLIFNTKNEISSLTELGDGEITETERARLIFQKDFALKMLLLSLVVCLVLVFSTAILFYYSSIVDVKVHLISTFLGAEFGVMLFMVLTLWRINTSINDFKTEVKRRKESSIQASSISKRLGKKTQSD
jgi:hypothetical protein